MDDPVISKFPMDPYESSPSSDASGRSPSNYSSLASALTMPLDYSKQSYHTDTSGGVPFQLPAFLTGTPASAPGGGADVLPGSFTSVADLFGAPRNSYDYSSKPFTYLDSDCSQSDSKWYTSKSSVPPAHPISYDAPRPPPLPSGPFSFSTTEVEPSPVVHQSTYEPPPPVEHPTPSYPPSLPSNLYQITGPTAPPLYSTTGFDMMGILARVASRSNPQIVLGPVDFSCSFVLVDVRRYDHPIVYASPTFLKLTGYEANEVVGRNCRFLQAPDGNVPRGSQRTFTDPSAVNHINKSLLHQKECQANLMNYRKGGQPFLNLVSIIPIPWDADSDEIRYHVGFQVDLVHQPNAILQTMRDGTYLVNYSTMMGGAAPTAGLGAVGGSRGMMIPGGKSTISKEMREVMAGILPGGMEELERSADEKNRHDLNALLLDQSDDFIHVLSVKGIIQYASPSLLRVLEYTSDELIGKHLSDIAHPQDLTPITRELKESSTSQKLVRLLFRVRRKNSGMVWMESCGRLHLEPGKTRKSVVFGGRVREISGLKWGEIERAGGLADDEFWAKISVGTGLVVWASEAAKEALGRRREQSKESRGSDEPSSAGGIIGTRLKDLVIEEDWEIVRNGMENACAVAGARERNVIVPAKLRIPANQSKGNEVTGQEVEVETELVMYVPDVPMGTFDKLPPPSESIPPHSASFTLGPPKPSSLLIQFCLKSSVPPRKRRKLVHSSQSAVYEELDISRASNWCYEVERVRQVNERMKGEIAALESSLGKRMRSETV